MAKEPPLICLAAGKLPPESFTTGLHAAAPLNKAGSLLSRFPSGHEVECRKGAEIDKYKKSAKAILSACLQYTMEKMLCQDRQKNEGYYAKNAFCEKMHPLPFRPGMDRWWPLLQPFGRRRDGRTACRKARLRGIRPAAFRLCRNVRPGSVYLQIPFVRGSEGHTAAFSKLLLYTRRSCGRGLANRNSSREPKAPTEEATHKDGSIPARSTINPPSRYPKSLPPQWNP